MTNFPFWFDWMHMDYVQILHGYHCCSNLIELPHTDYDNVWQFTIKFFSDYLNKSDIL
jgi:hypothetical protein